MNKSKSQNVILSNKEVDHHIKIRSHLLSRSLTIGYTNPTKKTQGNYKSERVNKEIYLLVQKNMIFRRSMRMSLKNKKEEWVVSEDGRGREG